MLAQFKDRTQAGRLLVQELAAYADRPDVVVLALPRGGVPVAYEVAEALRVPLDVFPVRKLGVPGHGELAMGAIAGDGVRVINEDVVQHLGITGTWTSRRPRTMKCADCSNAPRRGRLAEWRKPQPAKQNRGKGHEARSSTGRLGRLYRRVQSAEQNASHPLGRNQSG